MAAIGQVASTAGKAAKVPGWVHFVPIGDPRGYDQHEEALSDDERARELRAEAA